MDRTAQPVKMCFVRGLLNLAKLNRTARRDAAALQLHGPLKCYLLIYSGVYIYIYIYIYIYVQIHKYNTARGRGGINHEQCMVRG